MIPIYITWWIIAGVFSLLLIRLLFFAADKLGSYDEMPIQNKEQALDFRYNLLENPLRMNFLVIIIGPIMILYAILGLFINTVTAILKLFLGL